MLLEFDGAAQTLVVSLALKVLKECLQEAGKTTGTDRDECRENALPDDGHETPWFGDDLVLLPRECCPDAFLLVGCRTSRVPHRGE